MDAHLAMRTRAGSAGWLVLLAVLAGCAGDGELTADTVLNYDQCQGIDSGLTVVDYADVAGIRGSKLLRMGGDNGAESPVDAAEEDRELVLIAISRGRQPTPGYRLTLAGAERLDATALISVLWETPPSGSILPQAISHPCLVVSLPKSGLRRVEAFDQAGDPLGAVAL